MLALAEIVVVAVFLIPGKENETLWEFLCASGLALWLVLMICGTLVVLRTPLMRCTPWLGMSIAVLLCGIVTGIGTGIIYAVQSVVQSPFLREQTHIASYSLRFTLLALILSALILRYFYLADSWRIQVQAHAQAKADALQARIRPHFLFNSMNLIASLLPNDPVRAEQVVMDLSDLFRAALNMGDTMHVSTLKEEYLLAKRYLAIEVLRLGARLQVEWKIATHVPWEMQLPTLVLQPLVENAIQHGVALLTEGGSVSIDFIYASASMHITITNPIPQTPQLQRPTGAGHAQSNIRQRLLFFFGSKAQLQVESNSSSYCCHLVMPYT